MKHFPNELIQDGEKSFPEYDLSVQEDENERWINEEMIMSTFEDEKIRNFFRSSVYFNQKETLSTHYFYYKLMKFLQKNKENPFPTNPIFKVGLYKLEVNFHLLFKIVRHFGGYDKCCKSKKWLSIYTHFFPSDKVYNHSDYPIQKLKRVYAGFLLPYEEKIDGKRSKKDEDDDYHYSSGESESEIEEKPLIRRVTTKSGRIRRIEEVEDEFEEPVVEEEDDVIPSPPPPKRKEIGSIIRHYTHHNHHMDGTPVQQPQLRLPSSHVQLIQPPPPPQNVQRPQVAQHHHPQQMHHQTIEDPRRLGKRSQRDFQINPYNPYQHLLFQPPQSVVMPAKKRKIDHRLFQPPAPGRRVQGQQQQQQHHQPLQQRQPLQPLQQLQQLHEEEVAMEEEEEEVVGNNINEGNPFDPLMFGGGGGQQFDS